MRKDFNSARCWWFDLQNRLAILRGGRCLWGKGCCPVIRPSGSFVAVLGANLLANRAMRDRYRYIGETQRLSQMLGNLGKLTAVWVSTDRRRYHCVGKIPQGAFAKAAAPWKLLDLSVDLREIWTLGGLGNADGWQGNYTAFEEYHQDPGERSPSTEFS